MKASLYILGISLFTLIGLYSCGSSTPATPEQKKEVKTAETWECPMKCDGKKFEKAGQCPVCEMDLVKVVEG